MAFRRAQLLLSIAAICVCIGFLFGELMDPNTKESSPSLLEEAVNLIEDSYVREVSRSGLLEGAALAVRGRLEEFGLSGQELRAWSLADGVALESSLKMSAQLKILARDSRFGLSEQEWAYVAIQGSTESLRDKYSRALDPESYFQLKKSLKRHNYVGVGLSLAIRDKKLLIVDVLPNSPADAAEIRNDDVLLELDGLAVQGRSVKEVETYLQGDEGTEIELLLSRHDKTWRLTLRREFVRTRSVSSQIIELEGGGKVCWILVESLSEGSSSELAGVLDRLAVDPPLGCVLDLRGNRGGYLKAALELASFFLQPGQTVVVTSEREKSETRQATSVKHNSLPLFVLVDHDTASSAEILTGALQDHKRARVFGVETYGKGSVQSLLELNDGGALKITTATYETPLGRRFDSQGLMPDRVIKDPSQAKELILEECREQWKAGK